MTTTTTDPSPTDVEQQVTVLVTEAQDLAGQIEEAEARLAALRSKRIEAITRVVDLLRDTEGAARRLGISRGRLYQLRDAKGGKIMPRPWQPTRAARKAPGQ